MDLYTKGDIIVAIDHTETKRGESKWYFYNNDRSLSRHSFTESEKEFELFYFYIS